MKVEQMRKAILEGIKMDVFAKPPFQVLPGAPQFPGSVYPPGKNLNLCNDIVGVIYHFPKLVAR